MTEPKHEPSPPTAGAKPSAPAPSTDTARRRRSPGTRKPQPRTADTGYLPGRRVWPD